MIWSLITLAQLSRCLKQLMIRWPAPLELVPRSLTAPHQRKTETRSHFWSQNCKNQGGQECSHYYGVKSISVSFALQWWWWLRASLEGLTATVGGGALAAAQVLLHSLTLAHQASQHTGHSTWNTRNTNTQIQNTGGSGTPSLTIPRHNTQKTHTDAQIKDTAHAWHIVAH